MEAQGGTSDWLLLNLTTPALSVVSAERLTHCLPLPELFVPAQQVIQEH